jgi:hypothetical protein
VTLLDARQHAAVEHLREWLLATYAGAIGAALLVRTSRAALEKGRGRDPLSSSRRPLIIRASSMRSARTSAIGARRKRSPT